MSIVYRNFKKVYFLFLFIMLLSCNNNIIKLKMNNTETKIYEAMLIAKNKINNFKDKEIKSVCNLIEDRENFVVINISDEWYVLAIDAYDEITNKKNNNKLMNMDGWRYTLKAEKGDIAKAPELLVNMAKNQIYYHTKSKINIELLNKALGLN